MILRVFLLSNFRRSFDLKYAVDTFCYGMFLFDLVTGKNPSVKDPKTNKLFRDVMLKRSPQEPIDEYVDKNVGYDHWAKVLYSEGKKCTNEIANKRPKMESVLLSISSPAGVPNVVNDVIPDIVRRPIPENSGSCIVVTEEDITSESASTEMSKETSN